MNGYLQISLDNIDLCFVCNQSFTWKNIDVSEGDMFLVTDTMEHFVCLENNLVYLELPASFFDQHFAKAYPISGGLWEGVYYCE